MLALYLLAALGDDSFEVRRQAHAALEAPACRHLLPLIALACNSPDPEIANRADQIAGVHRRGVADEWAASVYSWPWIDSMPEIDSDALNRWMEGTDAGELAALGDWPRYREATRRWAWGQVAGGVSPAEIEKTLALMRTRCEFWRANNKYPEP